MAKKPSRVVWCDRPGYWPQYGFAPDQEAWQHAMRDLEITEPYPQNDAATVSFTREARIMCLVAVSPGGSPRCIAGILAHEAVHVYESVIQQMGEETPGSEFHAYSIQEIFDNLVKAYEQTRGRLFLKDQSAETVA